MEKDDFLWLQHWYQVHCNGNWEQDSRVHPGTIDNLSWLLKINLEDNAY